MFKLTKQQAIDAAYSRIYELEKMRNDLDEGRIKPKDVIGGGHLNSNTRYLAEKHILKKIFHYKSTLEALEGSK